MPSRPWRPAVGPAKPGAGRQSRLTAPAPATGPCGPPAAGTSSPVMVKLDRRPTERGQRQRLRHVYNGKPLALQGSPGHRYRHRHLWAMGGCLRARVIGALFATGRWRLPADGVRGPDLVLKDVHAASGHGRQTGSGLVGNANGGPPLRPVSIRRGSQRSETEVPLSHFRTSLTGRGRIQPDRSSTSMTFWPDWILIGFPGTVMTTFWSPASRCSRALRGRPGKVGTARVCDQA
jgi:hypothetical protein